MDGGAGVGVVLMVDELAGGVDGFVEEVVLFGIMGHLDGEGQDGDKNRY